MNGRDHADRQALLAAAASALSARGRLIRSAVDRVSGAALASESGVRVVYHRSGDVEVFVDEATPYGWITEERRP